MTHKRSFNPGPWGFTALVLGALTCFLAGGNRAMITLAVILTVLGAILLGWALTTGKTTFLGTQKRDDD